MDEKQPELNGSATEPSELSSLERQQTPKQLSDIEIKKLQRRIGLLKYVSFPLATEFRLLQMFV
jgi:hypothetical protein